MSRLAKVMQKLSRARNELEEACRELQAVEEDEDRRLVGVESQEIEGVRARVDALEARVAAIEGRGDY